jgi:hypothetical protein
MCSTGIKGLGGTEALSRLLTPRIDVSMAYLRIAKATPHPRKDRLARVGNFSGVFEVLMGGSLATEQPGNACMVGVVHLPRWIDMTRVLLVKATLALLAIARPSEAQPRAIDPTRSTVTVRVFKSGLFRAFADDHVIEASVAEGSLDDSAMPTVQIAIDVRAMRVLDPSLSPKDRQEVQTRMLGAEVLDGERFPHIRFRSVTVQRADPGRWSVRGELDVHGQTHPVTVNVVREQGHYRGSTALKQSVFGITPISVAGGTVKVKDEIKVDFDIVTTER